MRTLGVDVSHWEGSIDWKAAAPGLGFAFYKCTDGVSMVDDQFANNRQGCTEAGLAHAPYHYYQSSQDPLMQAEHFIRTAGRDYHRYIVDVEAPQRVEGIAQKLLVFLKHLEQLTRIKPAIYTSAGYWNEFVHPHSGWAKDYDLLVAHYTVAHQPILPIGWTTWRIWQFSEYWNFPGCHEVADADWFNGGIDACQAWFGNASAGGITEPVKQGFKLRALFDGLHIRQSPDLKARITGEMRRDEVVEVEQLGGFDVWVRHARGWTAVERGGYRYMEVVK